MNMLKSCLKHVKMPFGVNTNTNTNEYNETHLNQENKKIKKIKKMQERQVFLTLSKITQP